MKSFFLFIFFIFPYLAFNQRLLKGVVLDAEKSAPVPGASVFLSNTSVGTVTNAQGVFELTIPAGRFDLIVSSIGFETYSQTITTEAINAALPIKLQLKAKELETVVVAPFEPDGWAKWGLFFLENFIGTSALAKDCAIKNTDVLKFRHSKKTGALTAIAFEPLVIQNKALGYTLRYQLETFDYNFNTGYLLFQGYPFFEPMQGGAARQKRWAAKRKKTYEGSMLHFMRSVYRNKIGEQGFEVRALQKNPNVEKKRIRQLYKTRSSLEMTSNKDSAAYYEKILRQPDQFEIIGKTALPCDSIAYGMDSVTAGLYFNNYLLIIYKKGLVAAEFRQRFPDAGSAMASQITLLNDKPVAVQANGSFYEPADLLSLGYWSWSEKMATMLPFDYVFDK